MVLASLNACTISRKNGGTYLEMQLERSNEDNDRLIVMAGACTAYLPLQLIKGVYLVGLAEVMHMAEQCGIQKELICKLLQELGYGKYLTNKAENIFNQQYTVAEQTLEELQENILLGLYLNQELKKPLPLKVCSAVNQRLMFDDKYDNHGGFDSSIIFSIFKRNEV
nr:unnamed protein product [Callosobruchus chinensis]